MSADEIIARVIATAAFFCAAVVGIIGFSHLVYSVLQAVGAIQ